MDKSNSTMAQEFAQEFHRQLFNSAEALRQEIKRITGLEIRELFSRGGTA
jgi:hypothetical protein